MYQAGMNRTVIQYNTPYLKTACLRLFNPEVANKAGQVLEGCMGSTGSKNPAEQVICLYRVLKNLFVTTLFFEPEFLAFVVVE